MLVMSVWDFAFIPGTSAPGTPQQCDSEHPSLHSQTFSTVTVFWKDTPSALEGVWPCPCPGHALVLAHQGSGNVQERTRQHWVRGMRPGVGSLGSRAMAASRWRWGATCELLSGLWPLNSRGLWSSEQQGPTARRD